MTVTIKFYYSPSKKYESVCEQAKSFANFTQSSYENQIILTEEELRDKEKRVILDLILNAIRDWSGTTYYIDKTIVKISKIREFLNIIDCEQGCGSCLQGVQEHCYSCYDGWGCKFLTSIALVKDAYEDYTYRNKKKWYDFGKFENEIWIIDKESILKNLMQEVTEKNLLICSYFSEERVQNVVNSLPDKIEITDAGEWEYKYKDVPFGVEQKEIIGVRPKINHEHSSYTTIIDLCPDKDVKESKMNQNDKPKNIPLVKFSDIGGCDDIIQQVREVIELPLVAPDLIKHYGITPHKGILLYGPPGCGKTMIAKAVANEIEAHFITINGPEILNKYVGQSEENLRDIFTEAERNEPSIIYFDEFDSIASTRDSKQAPYMSVLVNQLLTLMDGMDSSNKICCIASTNRVDLIDPAIKRPGRFDYVVEVHRPSLEGCKAIFDIYTSKMPVENNFNKDLFVENYLAGCSGADIEFVASEAAYNSIRRTVDFPKLFKDREKYIADEQNIVTESDFIKAAKCLKQRN